VVHNWRMERVDAVRQLPVPYAIALRLRDAGVADDTIARSLDVDADCLGTVLAVAEQKLEEVLRQPEGRATSG
jgi:hypothetical protein